MFRTGETKNVDRAVFDLRRFESLNEPGAKKMSKLLTVEPLVWEFLNFDEGFPSLRRVAP